MKNMAKGKKLSNMKNMAKCLFSITKHNYESNPDLSISIIYKS